MQTSYLYVTVHEDNNKLFHIELINLGRIVGASFWPHPLGPFSYMFHSKSSTIIPVRYSRAPQQFFCIYIECLD